MKKIAYFILPFCMALLLIGCGGKTASTDNGNGTEDTEVKEDDKKTVKASPYTTAEATVGAAKLAINYSSPRTKGRTIWGELVPYDEVWRTGADEATVFETNSKLMIEGKELLNGKYALFTIPGENEWTIIFNNVHNQWGAFNYDESKDALRVKVKPMMVEESMENMTFYILESGEGEGEIKLAWDKLKVSVAFKVVAEEK